MNPAFSMPRTGSGTREWSEHSCNIGRGCSHGCLYCYARANSLRWGHIPSPAAWTTENVTALPRIAAPKKEGVIMFPTTHDITPFYFDPVMVALDRLLSAGNCILITTKPHLHIIREITDRFKHYRDNILFRFTITTLDDRRARLWEPGAPPPSERLDALVHAYLAGFSTSVSAEPILGGSATGVEIFRSVKNYVTDKVWFGKLNQSNNRIHEKDRPDVARDLAMINKAQRDSNMIDLYRTLRNDPKASWKESIRSVVVRD